MSAEAQTHTCPQCGIHFLTKENSFPFCSQRCQLLDLGAWANEKYRVPVTEDSDEDGTTQAD